MDSFAKFKATTYESNLFRVRQNDFMKPIDIRARWQ